MEFNLNKAKTYFYQSNETIAILVVTLIYIDN